MRQATQLVLDLKYRQALSIYDEVERMLGTSKGTMYMFVVGSKCCMYHRLRDEPAWRRESRRLVVLGPNLPYVALTLATHLIHKSRHDSAKQAQSYLAGIDRKLCNKAQLVSIAILSCHSYIQLGQSDRATALSRASFERYGGQPLARITALAYSNNGQTKLAAEWHLKAAGLTDNKTQDLLAAAINMRCHRDLAGAHATLATALALDPHDKQLLLQQVSLLQELNDVRKYGDELESCLKALSDQDTSVSDRVMRLIWQSNLASGRSQLPKAFDLAQKALVLAPNKELTALALGVLADVCMLQDRFDSAQAYLKRLRVLRPKSAHTLMLLGQCAARQGQLDTGIDFTNKAIAIDPSSLEGYKLRAALNCARGQMTAAAADVRRMQALAPDDNYSIDTVRSIGLKYCSNIRLFMRNATAGWEMEDSARLHELADLIDKERDPQAKARLLEDKATIELLCGEYKEAISDADAVITLGYDSFQVHAIKAGALSGLKDERQAKKERMTTVALFAANPPSPREAAKAKR